VADHAAHAKPRYVSALSLHSPHPVASAISTDEPLLFVGGAGNRLVRRGVVRVCEHVASPGDDHLDSVWKFSVFTDDIVELRAAFVAPRRTVTGLLSRWTRHASLERGCSR
jgi:hypothetical protein